MFEEITGSNLQEKANFEGIKEHYFNKEHLPIGDIRIVVDDGSD